MPAPVYLNTINRFSGDGVTTDWNINFTGGYLRRAHVKGIVTNSDGTETLRTLTISDPADFIGPNQIRVSPAAAAGEVVVLFRDTPKDLPLVDFSDGSLISEKNLDLIVKQAVFISAEMVDKFGQTDGRTTVALDTAQLADLNAQLAQAQAILAAAKAATASALASDLEGRVVALEEGAGGGEGGGVAAVAALDARLTVAEETLDVLSTNLPAAFTSIYTSIQGAVDEINLLKGQTSFGITDTIFALSAVVPAADTVPYFLSPISAGRTPLTAYGRSLMAAADAAAAQTLIGASDKTLIATVTGSIRPDGLDAGADTMPTDVMWPMDYMRRMGDSRAEGFRSGGDIGRGWFSGPGQARRFYVNKTTVITKGVVQVSTAGTKTVTARIYAAATSNRQSRPGVAVSAEMTFNCTTIGTKTHTFGSPITLTPGLYYVVESVSASGTDPSAHCVAGVTVPHLAGRTVTYTAWAPNTPAIATTSADLSATNWAYDTTPGGDAARDHVAFDFTV